MPMLIIVPVLPGRACALNPLEGDNATTRCCVPCPLFDYVYDDGTIHAFFAQRMHS